MERFWKDGKFLPEGSRHRRVFCWTSGCPYWTDWTGDWTGEKKQKIRRADILGIGMAAPGAVTADGILHGAVNIGWGDVALAEEAERIIGISPVCVGNDARLAALGEAAYGAGVGARSMLMVTLGTGVGGGVVLNGKVLMGESGVAGEIGHMTVNPFETVRCNCGKMGCLEQYASATGMVARGEAGSC